ncbi:hypothetical protein LSH36_320g00001 [Paralvinella palmiformis]|uniref:Integrator complex subunit 1 n=1 Tax=Paralvinella palmiformis TaxID=53620 RepID=A0AAD9JGI8_9ANNE|nr:hypothetical protein LSH36_320g00001 [Paralvinella palmiformis]
MFQKRFLTSGLLDDGYDVLAHPRLMAVRLIGIELLGVPYWRCKVVQLVHVIVLIDLSGHAPPGDFIALGTKSEVKASVSAQPVRKAPAQSSTPTKREAPITTTSTLVLKKPKLGTSTFTPLGRHDVIEKRASPTVQVYLYEEIAKEVDPSEFLDFISQAADIEDDERVEALLCGAVRYLKVNRIKPESSMYLSLMYLAKYRGSIFNSEVVIEAFCSLLKREVSLSYKTKGNPLVSVLACNVLLGAFIYEENWPDHFVKVYMDDALGERIWVDRHDCKAFVENIQSAFNTKMPKFSALNTDDKNTGTGIGAGGGSPTAVKIDDDEDSTEDAETSKSVEEDVTSMIFPRYPYQQVSIESYVLDILREQLSRRQSMDGGSRNLLRVMTATCGYTEVRTMAVQRLEMWLQNPKLTRAAQDLLMSVCMNCDQHSSQDIEVMNQLCKIRLKLKPLVNHYLLCVSIHNICIHGDIAGSIWKIRNDLVPDDCCFLHEETAELVCQEFIRGAATMIELNGELISVSSKPCFTRVLVLCNDEYIKCVETVAFSLHLDAGVFHALALEAQVLATAIADCPQKLYILQKNTDLLQDKELIAQHPDNLRTLMTYTVYNELSNSRNPNNMALLSVMFNMASEHSAKLLAEVFQDLLSNRDEYLRGLRILLREIVRGVRQDMNFVEFALGLMKERTDSKFTEMETQHKDRLFMSLADLITLTALLSVSPAVKEVASALIRGDQKDLEALHSFQNQMAVIQRDAVSWLHTIAPKMFDIKQTEYVHCLRKVLFLEVPEHYTKVDNWPPENDRSTMLRLVSEVPVLEDTLLRILIMGLTREVPVNATDAIELVDQLITRAALQASDDFQVLVVERVDFIDLLLNLCTYRHPENISLPKGYKPPALAITNLYWKAWTVMLVISAFNPSKIGFAAWENYPMLKCLMEMVMTSNFRFPPPTMATEEKTIEEIKNREKQLSELEKQQILEFEGHLAAATSKKQITEANSLLLSQLTTMDPSGPPRQPPQQLLDQLETLNRRLGIGHLLCRSRNPDFLLDIIHRQGTSQSMPWLAELVESSESSLDVLPVQCLCEFLLHDTPGGQHDRDDDDDDGRSERQKLKYKHHKHQQLLGRLQTLLHSSTSDARTICEVLGYFLKRLSSQTRNNRLLAVKGLSMVLSKDQLDVRIDEPMDLDDNPAAAVIPSHKWLLEQLPFIPQFSAVKPQACAALRQACQVETDSAAVSAYIVFLSQHTSDLQLQELDELALDLAQLIVERATLMNHLLPQEGVTHHKDRAEHVLASMINLFYSYLIKAQQPDKEAYSWSNTRDQILLQWESGKSATINVLVVHAMIILLTYSEPKVKSFYREMCDTWFPETGNPPSAYLVDTSEEALLLPDWLKLRMIRSCNDRLVDAALVDLEPSQLLLFVQSFGIPVASMSKLLKCLDQAVLQDSYTMEQVVVDKGYMAQLVQVQHMRGAQGGNRFCALLLPGGVEQPSSATKDVDMILSPRRRTLSHVSKTPILSSMEEIGQSHVISILRQVFNMDDDNQSVTEIDRSKTYRILQKSLSKVEVCKTVNDVLLQLIKSEERTKLISSLKMYLHFSCPLLRLLIAKEDYLGDNLSELMTLLAKTFEDCRSSVANLVSRYLTEKAGTTHIAKVSHELDILKTKVNGGEEAFKTVLSIRDNQRAENFVNLSMVDCIKSQKVKDRSATLTEALQVKHESIPQSTTGLLVDWLQLLDPEIISHVPELQQQILFSKQPQLSEGIQASKESYVLCQPYLLALLTHQTSWSSLHKSVELVLSRSDNRFSASAALDFLYACIYIPKIWQGRDKRVPKNSIPEDILKLTVTQIQCVVSYMLEEALSETHTSDVILQQRIPLLLRCCCKKYHLLRAVTDYLYERIKKQGKDQAVSEQLLLELYLQIPDVVDIKTNSFSKKVDCSLTQKGTSQLDVLTHRIISTLGSACPGKNSENKMYDASIACRKLASQHPLLVLRQLPMISALLQSRAQFSFGEVKHRNHLLLYTHILGILEFLQPYIFYREYYKTLDIIFKSFFELIRFHGLRNRQLGSVIVKFIKLLNNFMLHSTTHAGSMLHQYTDTLNELTNPYPDLVQLRELLAGLTLPQRDGEPKPEPIQKAEVKACDLNPSRPCSPINMAQLTPYLATLAKGSTADVLNVLQDLDETSKRKVDILQYFQSDLCHLLSDQNDQCRNTAHSLVMRYVRHDPGSATQFVPAVIQCMEHPNLDVVNSVLKNLPEFTLLAQEYATEILQKAFKVGVFKKIDSASFISEAVQLLNMETMM